MKDERNVKDIRMKQDTEIIKDARKFGDTNNTKKLSLTKQYEELEKQSLQRKPKSGKQLGMTNAQIRKLVEKVFKDTGKKQLLVASLIRLVPNWKDYGISNTRIRLLSSVSVKTSDIKMIKDASARCWLTRK